MNNGKTPDKFSLYVPDEQEPEREMPKQLDIVDYRPAERGKGALAAGAYDPYSSKGGTSDTARSRKPRTDLRKLSEWIKTTQQVKRLRAEDLPPGAPLPDDE